MIARVRSRDADGSCSRSRHATQLTAKGTGAEYGVALAASSTSWRPWPHCMSRGKLCTYGGAGVRLENGREGKGDGGVEGEREGEGWLG